MRVGDVAPRIARILALIVGSLLVVKIVLSSSGLSWRHVALICVLLLGSVPPAGVMGGIGHVASHQPRPGTRGEQTVQLIRLRDLLQRLLAAVGSVVALSTLAIGASIRLQQTLAARSGHPGGKVLPPQFVLIFGGLGSVLVALFYVPAATALRRRAQCLCDELFPPPSETDDAAAILSATDNRQKLAQLLGADRNIIADLQAGLAILGPLLASAAAAFLSP